MQEDKNEVILGIDLGTTNSEVAVVRDGKVHVLKVEGSFLIPSVVSLDEQGRILIGQPAVNNELLAPTNTIRWIKRSMGRQETVSLGDETWTPAMVSSLILKRLKQAAEKFVGHPVDKAVITVPAFFTERQREATREAAELAGLYSARLLNEPTAAALAYSLGQQGNDLCLVYDLGGGTFDVSIVDLSSDIMEVKASHGDTDLGGIDFDQMIFDEAREQFMQEHEIDLAKDPLARMRLMRAAEAAKIRLSTEATADITEEFIVSKNGIPVHLKYSLTRTHFEEMIRPYLERALGSVRAALETSNTKPEQLNRVILVGGSTRIPLVSELLQKELKMAPQAWLDPSTVVVMGAAIEAASLSGETIGPLMVDITPFSLGTICLGNDFELLNYILIHRNTPLPCSASKVFYKTHPGQDKIDIKVYQGESSQIEQSQLLDEFSLEGLSQEEQMDIHIKFELDRSGLLHVTVTDIYSGKKVSHTVTRSGKKATKQANLADLDAIRIHKETEPVESEEYISVDHTTEITDPITLDDEQLLIQAQKLIDKGKLDPIDQDELERELQEMQGGNRKTVNRLRGLLYLLD